MTTAFAEAALAYAARGWPVFPCSPMSKIPATEHGFKDATTNTDQIIHWWKQCPTFNVAIATGAVSGIYVLDIDDKPGRSVDEALAQLGLEWPQTPTVRTGGGGVQLFFAFPAGSSLSITGGKLGLGIDTRGNGGYVVAPPSIHPNGTPYRWMDCEDAPLAPTPPALIARLDKQHSTSLASSQDKLTGGRHHTLMTAAALMRGIGLVPAEIAAALRAMVPRLDLSDGRVIAEKEIADIANWTADKATGLLTISSVIHGEQVAKDLAHNAGGALAEVCGGPLQPRDPGPFPERLLKVPGFIGRLAAFTDSQSNRQQPVFSLAGAIACLSVLTGRKVESEARSRTNCYCLVVAPSGSGKDAARETNKRLLIAAGCPELLGAEDFASDAGILSAIEQHPSVLFQIDEIGHVLKAISDPRAPPHLAGINAVLLRLYTSARSSFKGKAYRAADDTPIIDQPHAVLYGTTTPGSFWSSVSRAAVEDGLLGRCLIFTGVTTKLRQVRALELPCDLIEEAQWWHRAPFGDGNLSSLSPVPRVVEYTDEGGSLSAEIADMAERERIAAVDTYAEPLWARASQRIDQLALLYACSRDRKAPAIDAEALEWARDVVTYVIEWTALACARHLAENESEAATKRILRIIEEAGSEGISRNDLTRATQWIRGRKRERDDIIRELVDAEMVAVGERKTAGRGALVYVHSRFAPGTNGHRDTP